MNDPHVARLIYRIEHSDEFSFEKAEPLDEPAPGCRVRIDKGQATVEMMEHFATADEARAIVDPFLRAWEIDAGLNHGPGVLRFVYQRPEIIDRNPPPETLARLEAAGVATAMFDAAIQRNLARYPAPTAGIAFSSEADAMFDRFSKYKAGQTLLGDMVNFCLTVLVGSAKGGQRSSAAKKYRIDPDVLNTLGDLAAEKGGRLHARKGKGLEKDFDHQEIIWLEVVIQALIRRAAEVAHDPAAARQTITWTNLPDLSEASKKLARRKA